MSERMPSLFFGHRFKRLTRQQERELGPRVRRGDKEAIDQLVLANLPLLANVAKTFRRYDFSAAEMIGMGFPGLLRAAERFDERRKCPFGAYARRWIHQSIGSALEHDVPTISIPRGIQRIFRGTRNKHWETKTELIDLAKRASRFSDQDVPSLEYNHPASRSDSDDPAQRETLRERQERAEQLAALLDEIPPRYAQALQLYYGIGCEPRVYKEVSKAMGCTCWNAQVLCRRGLVALRKLAEHRGVTWDFYESSSRTPRPQARLPERLS